jgi:hypothetical protein
MLRTGRLPAPHRGRSSSASTSGSHPTPGVLLPGTLASPRAGLTPAGCRELVARLPRRSLPSVTSAPELLDAHSAGIAWGGCSRPAGLAPAAPGGGVDAGPRRPGQGQGPPQAVPQGREAPLTRPGSGVGSAGWPRQRPVRVRVQGPGRGAGTAGEAVHWPAADVLRVAQGLDASADRVRRRSR